VCLADQCRAPTASSWAPWTVKASASPGRDGDGIRASSGGSSNKDAPRVCPSAWLPNAGLQVRRSGRSQHQRGFPEVKSIAALRPGIALRWIPRFGDRVMIPNTARPRDSTRNEVTSRSRLRIKRILVAGCHLRGHLLHPCGRSGSGYGPYDHCPPHTTGGGTLPAGKSTFAKRVSAGPTSPEQFVVVGVRPSRRPVRNVTFGKRRVTARRGLHMDPLSIEVGVSTARRYGYAVG